MLLWQCWSYYNSIVVTVTLSQYWCLCDSIGVTVTVLMLLWPYWCYCDSVDVTVTMTSSQLSVPGGRTSMLLSTAGSRYRGGGGGKGEEKAGGARRVELGIVGVGLKTEVLENKRRKKCIFRNVVWGKDTYHPNVKCFDVNFYFYIVLSHSMRGQYSNTFHTWRLLLRLPFYA